MSVIARPQDSVCVRAKYNYNWQIFLYCEIEFAQWFFTITKKIFSIHRIFSSIYLRTYLGVAFFLPKLGQNIFFSFQFFRAFDFHFDPFVSIFKNIKFHSFKFLDVRKMDSTTTLPNYVNSRCIFFFDLHLFSISFVCVYFYHWI